MGISSQKIKVISNSVRDISKINKLKARKSFNLKKQDKIFLYVGHLLHVKGISYLFKAFDKMSKSDANLKLVIASSGRMACKKILKKYKSHIDKNKVIFFGKVNVEKLISASDILVLPYISNTGKHLFPSIMLEAFKINIPIITTNLETNKELIIHKKQGF